GPNFREHHALFDEHAGQLFSAIDPLAERVRKLGGATIISIGDAARRQRLRDCDSPSLSSQQMDSVLAEDNQQLLCFLREAHALCEGHGDAGSVGLLEMLIDQAEQRIWHLSESGRAAPA
ncbi:MAG: Dps family protein, partial [Bradyrhizobium sp.]